MYFFTVAPSISITLSEDSVEFHVKVHFYNPNDQKITVDDKKCVALSSGFQTKLREKTKLYI